MLFALLPARKAVIYNFIIAWLFLPMSDLPLHGFTDYNKMSAACFGVIVGAFVFDLDTILAFRPSVWDIPMLVWCICPFISSYYNDLGPYDGLSGIAYQMTDWGLPYFIGRIYFNDLKGLRELAHGIILGGLLYVPLVWYEIRMSPQLHRMVYGYTQYEFAQSKRYGGFRPMVFMQHGLAVSMWMTVTAMTAFWLWWSKGIDKVMGIKIGWVALILIVTAGATHSVGAIALMSMAVIVLWLTRITKWSIWIILLTLGPATWIFVRTTSLWTGEDLVAFIQQYDPRSADSLKIRLRSERVFVGPRAGVAGIWVDRLEALRQKHAGGRAWRAGPDVDHRVWKIWADRNHLPDGRPADAGAAAGVADSRALLESSRGCARCCAGGFVDAAHG